MHIHYYKWKDVRYAWGPMVNDRIVPIGVTESRSKACRCGSVNITGNRLVESIAKYRFRSYFRGEDAGELYSTVIGLT